MVAYPAGGTGARGANVYFPRPLVWKAPKVVGKPTELGHAVGQHEGKVDIVDGIAAIVLGIGDSQSAEEAAASAEPECRDSSAMIVSSALLEMVHRAPR